MLSEEGLEDPRRFTRRPGVDHRPAGRHPRVRRARAVGLGGARRAVGGRRFAAGGRQPPGVRSSRSPPTRRRCRAAVDRERPARDVAAPRARTPPRSSPTPSTPSRCASARPAPRRCRSSTARPTSTSTTAACTSGTRRRRPPSRSPPACTSAASTARRSSTTARDPWLPDFLVCRPRGAAGAGRAGAVGAVGLTMELQATRLRGRRPRRHRCGCTGPTPQRLDRPDARRVPLDPGPPRR